MYMCVCCDLRNLIAMYFVLCSFLLIICSVIIIIIIVIIMAFFPSNIYDMHDKLIATARVVVIIIQ